MKLEPLKRLTDPALKSRQVTMTFAAVMFGIAVYL